MKIFYFFFGSFVLAHIWVFVDVRRWLGGGWPQWVILAFFILMIALWGLRFTSRGGKWPDLAEDVSFLWLGFILITFMCFVAVDVAAIILRLAGIFRPSLAGLLPAGRSVPLALLLGLGLTLYASCEARNLRVTRYTVSTAKLPKGARPVRVAHLPDIHVSRFIGPRTLARMVRLVEAEKPDIIAVVGDLVDTDVSTRREDAAILASMKAPCGVFAVTGNHEGYRGLKQSLDFMKASGMEVLREGGVDACGIHVVGVDDQTVVERYSGAWDPTPVLKKYTGDKFVLLLKHRPGTPKAAIGLFDLQISGHTHNGQIWPGGIIAARVNETRQGLQTLVSNGRTSTRIVSNGVGFWGPPMRLFARPEIVIIDIVPEE